MQLDGSICVFKISNAQFIVKELMSWQLFFYFEEKKGTILALHFTQITVPILFARITI